MISNDKIDDVSSAELLKADHHEDIEMHINRNCYTQQNFYKSRCEIKKDTILQKIKNHFYHLCSKALCIKSLLNFFPFILILRYYTVKDFLADLVSGITVGIMHIPQGMAYGMLANIDPVYGLYTSFFPVIVYFFFGTSRHISMGTFAIVSLMIGTVVDNSDQIPFSIIKSSTLTSSSLFSASSSPPLTSTLLSSPQSSIYGSSTTAEFALFNTTETIGIGEASLDETKKIYIVMTLTLASGLFQLLLGLLHFGFVTVYLSEPLTRALTTGAGIHVLTSQLKHVFGYSTGRFSGPMKLAYMYSTFVSRLPQTNIASLVTSVICIIVLYTLQRWVSPFVKRKIKIPLPVEMIILIFCTILSYFFNFSSPAVFNMKVVGEISQGFPRPMFPYLSLMPYVMKDAIIIAIISFTINISMAKQPASKHKYSLDSNQELLAYGITNIVSSCFYSYVSTASLSRSLIQESTGGRTQVAGLISCCVLLLVLLWVGPLFEQLPNCVLAAVILVNLRGIFLQVFDICEHYKLSKYDMLTWIVTCVSVIVLDLDVGLMIGIAFSIATVVLRTQRPKLLVVGNVAETEIYESIEKFTNICNYNFIKVVRFDAPLYYANAERFSYLFKNFLKPFNNVHAIQEQNEILNNDKVEVEIDELMNIKYIILDGSGISFVDVDGIKALNEMLEECNRKTIKLVLAACKESLYDNLTKAIELKKLNHINLYLTVHDAMLFIKCEKVKIFSKPVFK